MKSHVLRFVSHGLFVVGLPLLSVGCSDGAPKRPSAPKAKVATSGTVKLDGNPVPGGSITYINIATGKKAIGTINDGAFDIEAKDGPTPGVHAVVIRGKENADGPEVWSWNPKDNSKIDADGDKKDFVIEKQDTKELPAAAK